METWWPILSCWRLCPALAPLPPQCPSLSHPVLSNRSWCCCCAVSPLSQTPWQPEALQPQTPPQPPQHAAGALHPSPCFPESGLGLLLAESGMMSLPEGGGGRHDPAD